MRDLSASLLLFAREHTTTGGSAEVRERYRTKAKTFATFIFPRCPKDLLTRARARALRIFLYSCRAFCIFLGGNAISPRKHYSGIYKITLFHKKKIHDDTDVE